MAGHHGSVTDSTNLHRAHTWEYADAAARTGAVGLVAGDVGKLARQLNDNTLWMLTDESPLTWQQVGGAGVSGTFTTEEGDVVETAATGTIDFDDSDFNVTVSPAGEANIALNYGTGAGNPAEGNHTHAGIVTGLSFVIDGGGAAITTGLKGFVRVPFAWTDIAKASLLADASTTAVVDVWKDSFANHPPTDADSITASAPLTLTADDEAEDSTLTGWTKTGSAGDVLAFNVDSNNNAELLTVALDLVRSL